MQLEDAAPSPEESKQPEEQLVFDVHPELRVNLEISILTGFDGKSEWLTPQEHRLWRLLVTKKGRTTQYGVVEVWELQHEVYSGTEHAVECAINRIQKKVDKLHGHGCKGENVIKRIKTPDIDGYFITPFTTCQVQTSHETMSMSMSKNKAFEKTTREAEQ